MSDAQTQEAGKEYYTRLTEWANLPFDGSQWSFLGLRCPRSISDVILCRGFGESAQAYGVMALNRVSFEETVATYLAFMSVDKNRDNHVSIEEIKESKKSLDAFVSNYNALLQNFGVIAGLVISVLYPQQFISTESISPSCESFAGQSICVGILYTYLAITMCTVTLSVLIILEALFKYKHMNFWMPNDRARLSLVRNTSSNSVVFIGQLLLFTLMIAVPFGCFSMGGPISGLMALVFLLVIVIYAIHMVACEEEALKILHAETKLVLAERADNEQVRQSNAADSSPVQHLQSD